MLKDTLNHELLASYAPKPGRHALLPELSARQTVALLCRVLYREGYNDHIAGHITVRLDDGTYLANPWELTWGEVTASDIVRLDKEGKVIEGEWNITPAINLHMDIHNARHDVDVVIHNHPVWGSVWSAAGRIPPVYDQTSALVDTDPVLYDEYRGTVEDLEFGRAAVDALGSAKWALLANHGVLVVGNGIRQAHLRAITLEWRSRLAWRVEAIGGGTPLPADVVVATGERTDAHGFPFLWEAMAREEIRRDATVLE
ncbi:MAG: class II aldolase/adducin family protein [Pseudomonas sp.]|jgi:ribulose-5-phosphate 4-epimerase/fuculose-1-phosphate aldolase|uniref:class II aldolase/adducin family protein n=1 Tax=Denitrificimonas caeni TaxID=521720 RepID=UPI000AF355A6|nr:class II aldolase/adducin family protein [Denitrificimonas caeni]MCK9534349.1 class II aldolase/adducin family protein [Pseudomonas sp.]MDY0415333.1 class II aldolase/adducin family protein [Pseudomonas sp.]NLO55039.1 class II aldolase/adducin family protein [Gammaproteobacteria bacterium]